MIFIKLIMQMCTKAELPQLIRKASLTHAQTYRNLLSFQKKHQGSSYLMEILTCSLQLFLNLCKGCGVTDITELRGFRSKSILAGDMKAKHPV
jgi:hypothetical protein